MADEAAADPQVEALRAELSAAQRTIEVLMDRVEEPIAQGAAGRFALTKTIGQLQDVVRQRSRALERSATHYRALFNESPDSMLTLDGDGRVSDCNTAAELLFGRVRADVQGATLSGLFDPANGAAITTLLWSGFSGSSESEFSLPDGRRLSLSVAPLGEDGWLLVLRDVTRAHQMDVELTQSRRLASIGQLAAAVAQEIQTPLSVIRGRIDLVSARPESDPADMERQLQMVRDQCLRIEHLIGSLQTFAVAHEPLRSRCSAQELMAHAIKAVEPWLRRLPVAIAVEPRDLEIDCDSGMVVRLVSSLLRHGADHGPRGAALMLRVRRVEGGVRLTVEAEFQMVSPQLRAELRSPYSGRQFDPALGLHLATAWALAQDHGGFLTAADGLTGGSCFHVTIPDVSSKSPMRRVRALQILVVDDDQLLCETVEWMLSQDGHEIVTTASAEEALERMERQGFDLVITDYQLPGMNGEQLSGEIASRWPDLAAATVLTSGLLHTPAAGQRYLQKPFKRAQLLSIIQDLDSGAD